MIDDIMTGADEKGLEYIGNLGVSKILTFTDIVSESAVYDYPRQAENLVYINKN